MAVQETMEICKCGKMPSGRPWMAEILLPEQKGRMTGNLCRKKSRVLEKETSGCQGSHQADSVRHQQNGHGEEFLGCFLQPEHSTPYLEPLLAASLAHSSWSSPSLLGRYSLQMRRASLHMPASCTGTMGSSFPHLPWVPQPPAIPSGQPARELTATIRVAPASSFLLCPSSCPDPPGEGRCSSISAAPGQWALQPPNAPTCATPRSIHILAGSSSRAERARSCDVKPTGSELSSSRNPE